MIGKSNILKRNALKQIIRIFLTDGWGRHHILPLRTITYIVETQLLIYLGYHDYAYLFLVQSTTKILLHQHQNIWIVLVGFNFFFLFTIKDNDTQRQEKDILRKKRECSGHPIAPCIISISLFLFFSPLFVEKYESKIVLIVL